MKRERDQLQQRLNAQGQATPLPKPAPSGSAQQLQDLQAALASAQKRLQVSPFHSPSPSPPSCTVTDNKLAYLPQICTHHLLICWLLILSILGAMQTLWATGVSDVFVY